LLNSGNEDLEDVTFEIIRRIGSPPIPLLVDLLRHESVSIRRNDSVSTFSKIRSKNPEIESINKPEWNIAAGIYYDRQLWKQWNEQQGGTEL